MRISDWSSDVCSSDLNAAGAGSGRASGRGQRRCAKMVLPAQRGLFGLPLPFGRALPLTVVAFLLAMRAADPFDIMRRRDILGAHRQATGMATRMGVGHKPMQIGRAEFRGGRCQYV